MHCQRFPVYSIGRLKDTARLLQRGDVENEKRKHVIRGTSSSAEQESIIKFVLPHCRKTELDFELANLFARRRFWKACGQVLARGELTEEQYSCIISDASKQADDLAFSLYILPHCNDDQLNLVLTQLVSRGMWHAVSDSLGRFSDTQRRWAITEASKRTNYFEFGDKILPHCTNDELGFAVKHLAARGQWQTVGKLSKRINQHVSVTITNGASNKPMGGWSEDSHKYVIDQAIETASENDFIIYVLPYCANDQLDYILTQLVKRGMWYSVDKVLQRGVSETNHRWAVAEAHKRADNTQICECILHHCPKDQLSSVLTQQVNRGLWRSVGAVLQRGVSCEQLKWVFEEAFKRAGDYEISDYLLPHCPDDQLDPVLEQLVKGDMWSSVNDILKRGCVSDSVHAFAVEEASKRAREKSFRLFIIRHCRDSHLETILPILLERNFWDMAGRLLSRASDAQVKRILTEACEHGGESGLWHVAVSCPDKYICWLLLQTAKREMLSSVYVLMGKLCGCNNEQLCELFVTSLLNLVRERKYSLDNTTYETYVTPRMKTIIKEIVECVHGCSNPPECDERDQKLSVSAWFHELEEHGVDQTSFINFEHFLTYFATHRRENFDYRQMLEILSMIPLFNSVQNVALRMMLKEKRWDVISQAYLSHVWEQVRRELFQAAVKKKQWCVVKQWADHTLYDDQRTWALEEAYRDKQWEVYLLLTDYGLTDIELMRVHYRLARYADWDTVLQSFQRGADVAEVRELLKRKLLERKTIPDRQELVQRCAKLRKLEQKLKYSKLSLEVAAKKGRWRVVFYRLLRDPSTQTECMTLDAALNQKAWLVVMQLVRLGIGKSHLDALFSQMLQQRQWGMCRVLMEQGIAIDLCLAALPEFMKTSQWLLIARIMEYDVDDTLRHCVMKCAMEAREGSVAWGCISMAEYRLTVKERETLFQRAFNLEIWQAVMPLIEERDSTGIIHRDTALLKAIKKHQWGVVDHCQHHYADINVKDAKGETPLLQAAWNEDWEAVEELVYRDGDQALLDRQGYAVLHRAIEAQQWRLVKILIEFQGNLHQPDHYKRTPLQMLIDEHKDEHIDLALLWAPGLHKGVNYKRETPLHAVCASGWDQTIYYLVARGVDPLTVTYRGESVLMYAVQNQDCPQKMVAECIKLGFSVHQPSITNTWCHRDGQLFQSQFAGPCDVSISPIEYSVLHNMQVITKMLYESGSCWCEELRALCAKLQTTPTRDLFLLYQDYINKHTDVKENVRACLPYIREIASTPRTLISTCRLVIIRCLDVRGKRHRDVQRLHLPTFARNYVMFSDLSDPEFGKDF